ncbi:FAD/NAD(P)-binding domain-containing protein [Mycena venus]|uniref:FAD/NAD(P)-binding domain-containing protein n=1 Tax=Mycena venus TaxID=2733690 RepID=A0A8H6XQV4_9AGAR|nr:FAD/NAD(P)-binding domain-containing protein [Mycena venus]
MSSPLDILVVGAGLGGLAAAAALRQQGHQITIFEESAVNKEIGAAIAMQENAIRVLEYLGFRKENLRAVPNDGLTHFKSDGQPSSHSFTTSQGGFFCHRVDLHDELKRLALDPSGAGEPAKLILGSQVVKCEAIEGTITLKNGDVIHADLIVGADGIHSTVRKDVLGYPAIAPTTGISAFSFSFSASKLERRPEFDWFTQSVSGGRVVTCQEDYNRRLFLCCCRDGSIVNVTAQFTDNRVQEQSGWRSAATMEDVVSEFSDFHPKFRQMLALAEQPIRIFQRRALPLLPTWVKGRVALLGDAAHAMFPTLGQGAAMALEDAGTLGCLFPREIKREDIQSGLEAYQYLRKPRGEFISREALEQIIIPEKRELFACSPEMRKTILDYDAIRVAKEYYADCSNKL